LGLSGLPAKQVLAEMLSSRFDSKSDDRLSRVVREVLNADPNNISGDLPGVVITNYKTDYINEPALFLGISKDGLEYPNIESPVSIIFLLVSPLHSPSQRILNILGNLARLLGSPGTIDNLKSAQSLDEIDRIITVANSTLDDPVQ
jgi:mannitol/fructose-specific phosphotransferase system IIA component (Ntr-type)